MNLIILEGPNGKREVEEGVPYRLLPGEKIVGTTYVGDFQNDNKNLEELAGKEGVGVGDLVAKLTKVFGIEPCSKCEERKKVLNKLRISNWKIKLDKRKK